MAKKTIYVAMWEYFDKSKPPRRRRAWYGDELDLSTAEIKRGEAAGVFDQPEPTVPLVEVLPEIEPIVPVVVEDDLAGLGADGTTPADVAASAADASGSDDGADIVADSDGAAVEAKATKSSMPKPANTASHEELVQYAVDQGLPEAEAAAMDRAALIKALA